MSALTFTPGKFYKTRDGRKARIYATDGESRFPVHGAFWRDDGWINDSWTSTGELLGDEPHDHDLIAEWVDAPEVDWSKMPEGTVAVAMDGDGCWFAHQAMPNMDDNDEWNMSEGAIGYSYELYPQHVPKWSGDCRDSLVTRPTEGGK